MLHKSDFMHLVRHLHSSFLIDRFSVITDCTRFVRLNLARWTPLVGIAILSINPEDDIFFLPVIRNDRRADCIHQHTRTIPTYHSDAKTRNNPDAADSSRGKRLHPNYVQLTILLGYGRLSQRVIWPFVIQTRFVGLHETPSFPCITVIRT